MLFTPLVVRGPRRRLLAFRATPRLVCLAFATMAPKYELGAGPASSSVGLGPAVILRDRLGQRRTGWIRMVRLMRIRTTQVAIWHRSFPATAGSVQAWTSAHVRCRCIRIDPNAPELNEYQGVALRSTRRSLRRRPLRSAAPFHRSPPCKVLAPGLMRYETAQTRCDFRDRCSEATSIPHSPQKPNRRPYAHPRSALLTYPDGGTMREIEDERGRFSADALY